MRSNYFIAALLSLYFYLPSAHALPDPTASTVTLKVDCGIDPACFSNMSSLLDWTWNTRFPTSGSPLLVNIGPGSFTPISCNAQGHVTFRGAGRNLTRISGFIGSAFTECQNINVQDLSIAGSLAGVTWFGGGSSNWVNVRITANYAAWYDAISNSGSPCMDGNQGRHTYFSTTLEVTNAIFGSNSHAFFNGCGKNWLWGSEIVMNVTAGGNSTASDAVFSNGSGNEVHLYGSNVRVTTDAGAPVGTQVALIAANNGEIHSHGTGIDVIAENPNSIFAIQATSGGLVHASESAYVLSTGTGGSVTRVSNNGGIIRAPHQWSESATAPNINSETGADTAVITGTNDGQPHMVVYSNTCANKWYDFVTASCI